MKRTGIRLLFLLLGLLMIPIQMRANVIDIDTDDTIPSRYRNYYYTEWYDECETYQNHSDCVHYVLTDITSSGSIAKYEYTNQPLKIIGLAAMVVKDRAYAVFDTSRPVEHLYLMKRIDTVDPVHPGVHAEFYRTRILDSARWDTVKPRVMAIEQNNSYDTEYCHIYEAFFDKPIVVDSEFYIMGSANSRRVTNEMGMTRWDHYPTKYRHVVPTAATGAAAAGCPPQTWPDSICNGEGRGHGNTKEFHLYWRDLTELGYPQTNDYWMMESYILPNDPFGVYFAIVENYKLEVNTDDSTRGIGLGGGIYYNSDGTEIQAVPRAGYRFSHWNDGNTENPRMVILTQDTVFTAYFDTALYYTVTTAVNEEYWGTVEGGGQYAMNTEVGLRALPSYGFIFERWNDGDTTNPRTFTLTQDTLFTAVFALDTTHEGISEADGLTFTVTPNPTGGELTVSTRMETPSQAEVFDAAGRCVLRCTLQGPKDVLDVRQLPAGRYLLRLNNGNRSGSRAFVKK